MALVCTTCARGRYALRRRGDAPVGPERIGDALPRFLARRGLTEGVSQAAAAVAWAEVVGPQVAQDAVAESCEGGTLTVVTLEATHRHTLQAMSRKIVARLNQHLGAEVVRRIRFRTASPGEQRFMLLGMRPSDRSAELDETDALSTVSHTSDREVAQSVVHCIQQDDVREIFAKTVERHLAADRALRARGWRPCVACGVLVSPADASERCIVCRLNTRCRRTAGN